MWLRTLIVGAGLALIPAQAASAVTVLREDGIGPLKLAMSTADAETTRWLSGKGPGCELAGPGAVQYQLRGPDAPTGLRGFANFYDGKLTGITITGGAETNRGIAPGRNSAIGMARSYRRAGYKVRIDFVAEFGGTFVTVSRKGRQRFSAFQTGPKIDSISIPYASTCE